MLELSRRGGVRLQPGVRPALALQRAVARQRARGLLSPLAWLMYEQLQAAVTIPGSKFDYSQVTALRISLRQRLQAVARAPAPS